MTKKIRLGLFGLGVVGSGLVNIINRKRHEVMDVSGIELEIVKAVVRDPTKKRGAEMGGIKITTNHEEILGDKNIDIIVELMGGTTQAKTAVQRALETKRPVVTANKALIAEYGTELFQLAQKNETPLLAEASVGGGIPILKSLRESLVGNQINSLVAIINGTTNFILTKMAEDGLSYFEALKLAGEKGFAEADPSFDVEGIDAKQKLLILAAHIYNGRFPQGDILCEGITKLTARDFAFAKQHGMTIKLLAIAQRRDEGVELRVHPTLIPQNHPLANVRNEFNAIFLTGDAVGEMMLYGRGAGSLPTASAVYADIIDICTRTTKINLFADTDNSGRALKIIPPGETQSEYYLRFTVEDKPGVIGQIATILGKHSISVSSAAAELIPNVSDVGEVDIMVHKTSTKSIQNAMKEINSIERVKGDGKYLRIEKGL